MGKFFADVLNRVLASAIWDTSKPYLLGATVTVIMTDRHYRVAKGNILVCAHTHIHFRWRCRKFANLETP